MSNCNKSASTKSNCNKSFCNKSFSNRVSAAVSASICAVALALTPEARATDVGGPITSDTTWTLAGSPYVAISTVTIRNGATLTIEAGVEVRFNQDLGIIIGHVSEGLELAAVGIPPQAHRLAIGGRIFQRFDQFFITGHRARFYW